MSAFRCRQGCVKNMAAPAILDPGSIPAWIYDLAASLGYFLSEAEALTLLSKTEEEITKLIREWIASSTLVGI
jgi:hypothetical protein